MEVREIAWERRWSEREKEAGLRRAVQGKRRQARVRKCVRAGCWMLLLLVVVLGMAGFVAKEARSKGTVVSATIPTGEIAWQEVAKHPLDIEIEKVEELDEVVSTKEEPSVPVEDVERKYLIVLDAGHGGEDEGCSSGAVEEKALNLALAQKVKDKLEEMDFCVLMTREDDEKVSLEERVMIANEACADAFVSIHQNTCEDRHASGVETWYYDGREENKRLAQLVQEYTCLYTKARDRGIKEANGLYVIREGDMPSCLVETGFLSNTEECASLQEEKYLEKIATGIAEAIALYFYPKTMYLTFDDGPVPGNTEKVLDILKEKNIKATFFVIGENVERYPEIVKRMVEEGHTIGIHCYEHDYKVIYASADSYLEDFERAKKAVYEVTGVEVKLFRFPGGSINSYNKKVYEEIIQEMTEQGYVYFDWNASLEDAVRNPQKETLLQNAKESTLRRKKVVMLAHDIVDETVECLEELIEQFPEYQMEALGEDVKPVQF